MTAGDLATRNDLVALREELHALRVAVERLQVAQAGELLTLPDAAVRLRRSLRTVERWAARGDLEVVHLGGARYVRLPAAPQQR